MTGIVSPLDKSMESFGSSLLWYVHPFFHRFGSGNQATERCLRIDETGDAGQDVDATLGDEKNENENSAPGHHDGMFQKYRQGNKNRCLKIAEISWSSRKHDPHGENSDHGNRSRKSKVL